MFTNMSCYGLYNYENSIVIEILEIIKIGGSKNAINNKKWNDSYC